MLVALLACADAPEPTPEPVTERVPYASPVTPADDTHLVPLDGPRLLRRLSLDLRGTLPTVAELDRVEADPGAIDTLRDTYLADPGFETRLMVLLGERWHTRVDDFLMYYVEYSQLASDPRNEYPFERAVGEEPLRLLAHIAAVDAPWTDIVTADYTLTHRILVGLWPTDRTDPGGDEWQVARYTDGRPAAGVLATNGLWWRYFSTLSNYNRGRAAALARLLLCEDYLSRPVSFSADTALVGAEGVESALRDEPYCMGCHSSLDPVASTLFGFYAANEYSGYEADHYHPAREPYGETALGLAPEWFGRPISGLAEMGQAIAADPRFARCTAITAAELYWRRPIGAEDYDRVDAIRHAWEQGDQRFKAAIRAATDSPVYRAGGITPEALATEADDEPTVRLMDATLLDPVLTDLTGFHWVGAGFAVLDNDTYGFRVLGGSVDGEAVTRVQTTPSLTWSLTVQRAAEGAAQTAVERAETPGSLLEGLVSLTPADPGYADALDTLLWHLTATHGDDDWRTDTTQLWQDVAADSDETTAWRAVLVAILRDPLFVSY